MAREKSWITSPPKKKSARHTRKTVVETTTVLLNTSFNLRGEPIVSTPEDAYRCFMRTEMDVLVLENCVLLKGDQKPLEGDSDWKKEFELD